MHVPGAQEGQNMVSDLELELWTLVWRENIVCIVQMHHLAIKKNAYRKG